ncbi:MAG: hypothetical protein ACXWG0_07885 [Chthoniobacterales bacterium]
MPREIKLDCGEITILKAIGLGGAPVSGKMLLARMDDMIAAEFLDCLDGLISLGYVLSNKVNIRRMEEVENAFLRVNQAYAHDLKDAIFPGRAREQRGRRERRR